MVRLYVKDSQEEKWVDSSQEGYDVVTLVNYKELENYVKRINEDPKLARSIERDRHIDRSSGKSK